MTPKVHLGLPELGPSQRPGQYVLCTCRPLCHPRCPPLPSGLVALGTLLAVPPQGAIPAGVFVLVSGTPGGCKCGTPQHSPIPGDTVGMWCWLQASGVSTKRAAAPSRSSLGCWEEEQPGRAWGSGYVLGAILHHSLCPIWAGTEGGVQQPVPGCTACPTAFVLPGAPSVVVGGGGQQGSGTQVCVTLQGTLPPSQGIDPHSAI